MSKNLAEALKNEIKRNQELKVSSNKYIKLAEHYMDNVARHYDPVPQEGAIIDFACWLDRDVEQRNEAEHPALELLRRLKKSHEDTESSIEEDLLDEIDAVLASAG